jgi:hypothetical protein
MDMTSLVGILLGLVAAVYLVYVVYLRDPGIHLRWPSLLIFAVIIGTAFMKRVLGIAQSRVASQRVVAG